MTTYTIPIHSTTATAGKITINAGGHGGGGTGYSTGTSYSVNNAWSNPSPGQIHVKGDAVFEGDITWQGRNMRAWFESVEARLNILQPNAKLEAEWEELADLRMKYVELEKQLLEKQQVFDILKKPLD
jgi:hypothetical protein